LQTKSCRIEINWKTFAIHKNEWMMEVNNTLSLWIVYVYVHAHCILLLNRKIYIKLQIFYNLQIYFIIMKTQPAMRMHRAA
jgi:hypothetical protein